LEKDDQIGKSHRTYFSTSKFKRIAAILSMVTDRWFIASQHSNIGSDITTHNNPGGGREKGFESRQSQRRPERMVKSRQSQRRLERRVLSLDSPRGGGRPERGFQTFTNARISARFQFTTLNTRKGSRITMVEPRRT